MNNEYKIFICTSYGYFIGPKDSLLNKIKKVSYKRIIDEL